MTTTTQSLDELLQQIKSLTSPEESTQVRDAMRGFKEQATEAEYETAKRALSVRLNELADSFEAELASEALLIGGKRYDLDEWLTIANYAKKYGVSTHVVTNDIRRGKIPADHVLELTHFNNLRMIKDQPYK